MNKDLTVWYISSPGRSGSTLLDIILGNQSGYFSCGELVFVHDRFYNTSEYCSCGKKLNECEFWKEVLELWEKKAQLDITSFLFLSKKYLKNTSTLKLIGALVTNNHSVKSLAKDYELLYECIAKVSGSSDLIDSSKNAQQLLLLRFTSLQVKPILLRRNLKAVIKSNKKVLAKSMSDGVEKDVEVSSTSYIVATWLMNVIFSYMFSLGSRQYFVKYENIVSNPLKELKHITKVDSAYIEKLRNRGVFVADHLCAGNRMRMKDSISIEKQT